MSDIKTSVQKKESENVNKTERTRSGKVFTPATDIVETPDHITLSVDMPGVDEKNIHITLENNVLTIRGDVIQDSPDNYILLYSEYDNGDYYRSFTLSNKIDRDKIEAKYKNGVLRLYLPKAEELKPRQIKIKTE